MDSDRFYRLARALAAAPSRRAITSALTGLALVGGLDVPLEPGAAAAKNKNKNKKRRNKKCKRTQKKCGKTCISENGCCPACGNRETCSFGFCICAPGTITCGAFCCVSGAEACYTESGHAPRCIPTT